VSAGAAPPRAALNDFGHTLVHYEVPDAQLLESYREARALVASAHPGRTPPDDLILLVARHVLAAVSASYERSELAELDHYTLVGEALAHHGYALGRELIQELAELEHRAFVRHLLVSPATHAALAELRARGMRLGLVSNVSVPGYLMRGALATLGLTDYFETAIFSSELGVRKPHRQIYETVLATLGVPAHESVFVGDRVREDIVGPQAAGMRAILTHEFRQEPPNGARPDGLVERFADLPALLTDL
jgi:putative hydrolase of the HAD superfamily